MQRKSVKEEVLDRLFRKIIKRDGICINCGKTKENTVIECAHGFSRIYRGTRWDEQNSWPLCIACHKYYTHRPIEWDEWMRYRLGDDYEALRQRAKTITKVDRFELWIKLKSRTKELGLDGE